MIGQLVRGIFKALSMVVLFVVINIIGIVICSKFLFEPILFL